MSGHKKKYGKIIGVHIGSQSTVMAGLDDENRIVILNSESQEKRIPTLISFPSDHNKEERSIGTQAKN